MCELIEVNIPYSDEEVNLLLIQARREGAKNELNKVRLLLLKYSGVTVEEKEEAIDFVLTYSADRLKELE